MLFATAERKTQLLLMNKRVYFAIINSCGKRAQIVPTMAKIEDVTRRSQSRVRSLGLISFPKIFR